MSGKLCPDLIRRSPQLSVRGRQPRQSEPHIRGARSWELAPRHADVVRTCNDYLCCQKIIGIFWILSYNIIEHVERGVGSISEFPGPVSRCVGSQVELETKISQSILYSVLNLLETSFPALVP